MISPRYAIAVCVMLVLALVPTVIHVYAGAVDADVLRNNGDDLVLDLVHDGLGDVGAVVDQDEL